MPIIPKEKERKIISMIKTILVRNPDATAGEMMESMERVGYKMDRVYIGKLLRKIDGEHRHYIETQILPREVAKFEDAQKAVEQQLWGIILSKDEIEMIDKKAVITSRAASPMVKTIALKGLLEARKKLFDTKFDAGVFERQIGKIKTESSMSEDEKKQLDQVIENVFRTPISKKPRSGK